MRERRLPAWAYAAFLALLLVAHTVSIFTENINWDEFSLLARAADTLATGTLQSGGRPGLGTVILIPFVHGCEDAVTAVRFARILWLFFTIALIGGFWTLLRLVLPGEPRGRQAAALGVGLLVLVPAFLRFSLHVRTDQPAVALGLWGGVVLIASRRFPPTALLAGAMFGVGFLFSQKLVYVLGFVFLLAGADLVLRREFELRREAVRLLAVPLGGLLVWIGYRELVSLFFTPPGVTSVASGLNVFTYYRATFGYYFYAYMLPTLLPHLILLGSLLLLWPGRRNLSRLHRARVLTACLVWAYGLAVVLFHAAAFPYFWLTMGLFPAAAGALVFPSLLTVFEKPRDRIVIRTSLWGILIAQAVIVNALLLQNTQREQRESLAFIDRNFSPEAEGFHPEGALFCRDAGSPFPTYFSQHIYDRFYVSPEKDRFREEFLDEFRNRPVAFLLDSWRLDDFPEEVRSFWSERYVRYFRSVYIPRIPVGGTGAEETAVEVIVPGKYRWESDPSGCPIELEGIRACGGDTIALPKGRIRVRFLRDVQGAALLYDVGDEPRPQERPFYRRHRELTGLTLPL